MKRVKTILTALLLLTAVSSAAAQDRNHSPYDSPNRAVYYRPQWTIDWRPDPAEGELYRQVTSRLLRRYTLAVHPFHLIKSGLKFDFEKELREPGQWLQFSVMGYQSPGNYFFWDEDQRMWGAGAGIGIKSMLSPQGFYFNAALQYNYYNLESPVWRYIATPQDGLVYYERKSVMGHRHYHQPGFALNVGKHMALGQHAFIDLFAGVGYTASLYRGDDTRYDDYLNFGYRGAYFNLGLRVGVLWLDRK